MKLFTNQSCICHDPIEDTTPEMLCTPDNSLIDTLCRLASQQIGSTTAGRPGGLLSGAPRMLLLILLVLEFESRRRDIQFFFQSTYRGQAQLDASRREKKELKSSRDENARLEPQWVGGERACYVTPDLSYDYLRWREREKRDEDNKWDGEKKKVRQSLGQSESGPGSRFPNGVLFQLYPVPFNWLKTEKLYSTDPYQSTISCNTILRMVSAVVSPDLTRL